MASLFNICWFLSFLIKTVSSVSLAPAGVSQSSDWLVNFRGDAVASVTATSILGPNNSTYSGLRLSNGLIKRTFTLSPCFATVDLTLQPSRTQFIRALSPEASLSLNGVDVNVGGCITDAHPEFFDPAVNSLSPDPTALSFVNYEVVPIVAPFNYVPGERHSSSNVSWPPKGVHLIIHFNVTFLPDPNASTFAGPFSNTQLACGGPNQDQCLQGPGTAHGCDTSVEGQCSFPKDTAVQMCADWDECVGVQCNPERNDCQARAAPIILTASHYDCYFRSDTDGIAGIDVSVHYELYDGLPVFKKWLTVQVKAPADPILVDNLFIEHLRAPNFAPEAISVVQIQPNNPTPFSQQIVPDPNQSFPGRTQQLWFFDADWDACCDNELHVSYSYYTRLMVGYGPDVTFGGPTGPGALVTSNDTLPFESIAVRLLFHDSTDWERQGLGTRRMQQYLAPQLQESPLYTMITDISTTETFQLAISQAAAAGLELVVVGYGANGYCGMCPEQIQNATWVAWFKSNVDYGKSLGVSVTAYTLMQHNGWGETVPEAEQVLNRDGSRGGIACFATDWHAAYRQSVLDFVQATGMIGVETDGQYENAYCGDDSGDHHHNGGIGSWHSQMTATADFNKALKAIGGYQTGADAYMWSGANKWNHADTDAGYSLSSLWERLSVGRDYIYDSTTTRLHSSGMYGMNNIASASRQCDPYPGRLACVDFALASFLGQGVVVDNVAASLWDPSDSDASILQAIFLGWSQFFISHRPILTSAASLHIIRPTSRTLEATIHLIPNNTTSERGMITIYNPSTTNAYEELPVSLYYAGFAPGDSITVTDVTPIMPSGVTVFKQQERAPTIHIVGSNGGGLFDVTVIVTLSPMSHLHLVITKT